MTSTPEIRAKELLAQLTIEEKLHQLTAQMVFDIGEGYEERRDPLCGSYRNPGHFMHQNGRISSPGEVARRINLDVKQSMEAQPHAIPPLEHGECLHGAQWGMATIFPQPIGLASTFDPALVGKAADVIGKETAAVGVRQALAPVVNLARDVRWGRTIETFGEDPKLAGDMGAAMCRGFEQNGVAATPKHFVDNYADGGRDSNYSTHSERELREVYLKPFEACFKEGGAHGVMAACPPTEKNNTPSLGIRGLCAGRGGSSGEGVWGLGAWHPTRDAPPWTARTNERPALKRVCSYVRRAGRTHER